MTTNISKSTTIGLWQAIWLGLLVPAVVHFLVLVLAVVRISQPAVWVSKHIPSTAWAVPLLWLLVLGGPLLSVLFALMFELGQGKSRAFGGKWGMFACAMLIVGLVTSLPMPWILFFQEN